MDAIHRAFRTSYREESLSLRSKYADERKRGQDPKQTQIDIFHHFFNCLHLHEQVRAPLRDAIESWTREELQGVNEKEKILRLEKTQRDFAVLFLLMNSEARIFENVLQVCDRSDLLRYCLWCWKEGEGDDVLLSRILRKRLVTFRGAWLTTVFKIVENVKDCEIVDDGICEEMVAELTKLQASEDACVGDRIMASDIILYLSRGEVEERNCNPATPVDFLNVASRSKLSDDGHLPAISDIITPETDPEFKLALALSILDSASFKTRFSQCEEFREESFGVLQQIFLQVFRLDNLALLSRMLKAAFDLSPSLSRQARMEIKSTLSPIVFSHPTSTKLKIYAVLSQGIEASQTDSNFVLSHQKFPFLHREIADLFCKINFDMETTLTVLCDVDFNELSARKAFHKLYANSRNFFHASVTWILARTWGEQQRYLPRVLNAIARLRVSVNPPFYELAETAKLLVKSENFLKLVHSADPNLSFYACEAFFEYRKQSDLFEKEEVKVIDYIFKNSMNQQHVRFRLPFIKIGHRLFRRLRANLLWLAKNEHESEVAENVRSVQNVIVKTIKDGMVPNYSFSRLLTVVSLLAELCRVFEDVEGGVLDCFGFFGGETTLERLLDILEQGDSSPAIQKAVLECFCVIRKRSGKEEKEDRPSLEYWRDHGTAVFLPKSNDVGLVCLEALARTDVNGCLEYFQKKLVQLESLKEDSRTNLLVTVSKTAAHPRLAAIRCLVRYLPKETVAKECAKLIHCCLQLSQSVAHIVNAQTTDSFEPISMDFGAPPPDLVAEMEKMTLEPATLGFRWEYVTSQALYVFSWRTMQHISWLLGELCNVCIGEIELQLVLDMERFFVQQLLVARHNGVFESTGDGFRQMLQAARRDKRAEVAGLAETVLANVFDILENEGTDAELRIKTCNARRSAGLPYLVSSTLSAGLQKGPTRTLVTEATISHLIGCIDSKRGNLSAANIERLVQLLNICTAIAREEALSEGSDAYLDKLIIYALDFLVHPDWNLNSAAGNLFAIIFTRKFTPAANRMFSSIAWKETSRPFTDVAIEWKSLFLRMKQILSEAVETKSAMNSQIIAICTVFGNLQIGAKDSMLDSEIQPQAFRELFLQLLHLQPASAGILCDAILPLCDDRKVAVELRARLQGLLADEVAEFGTVKSLGCLLLLEKISADFRFVLGDIQCCEKRIGAILLTVVRKESRSFEIAAISCRFWRKLREMELVEEDADVINTLLMRIWSLNGIHADCLAEFLRELWTTVFALLSNARRVTVLGEFLSRKEMDSEMVEAALDGFLQIGLDSGIVRNSAQVVEKLNSFLIRIFEKKEKYSEIPLISTVIQSLAIISSRTSECSGAELDVVTTITEDDNMDFISDDDNDYDVRLREILANCVSFAAVIMAKSPAEFDTIYPIISTAVSASCHEILAADLLPLFLKISPELIDSKNWLRAWKIVFDCVLHGDLRVSAAAARSLCISGVVDSEGNLRKSRVSAVEEFFKQLKGCKGIGKVLCRVVNWLLDEVEQRWRVLCETDVPTSVSAFDSTRETSVKNEPEFWEMMCEGFESVAMEEITSYERAELEGGIECVNDWVKGEIRDECEKGCDEPWRMTELSWCEGRLEMAKRLASLFPPLYPNHRIYYSSLNRQG